MVAIGPAPRVVRANLIGWPGSEAAPAAAAPGGMAPQPEVITPGGDAGRAGRLDPGHPVGCHEPKRTPRPFPPSRGRLLTATGRRRCSRSRSTRHRGLFGRTSARMMESEFVAGAMIAAAPRLKPQDREGDRPVRGLPPGVMPRRKVRTPQGAMVGNAHRPIPLCGDRIGTVPQRIDRLGRGASVPRPR
jgi:hypothetical protein